MLNTLMIYKEIYLILPERMRIKKCIKLVRNRYEKNYVVCCSHKSFKTSIRYGLILKKNYSVIQFHQKACSNHTLI